MTQRLLVEGKDYYVLAELCKASALPLPKGYDEKNFKDFIVGGKSCEELLSILPAQLKSPGLTNLGIVLDANEVGPQGRFTAIMAILQKHFGSITSPNFGENGLVASFDNIIIGLWCMPDNIGHGYLEHFLEKLIPFDDIMLIEARNTINRLKEEGKWAISDINTQKALIHTYLAWQKEPGKPFGTAIKAGYLDKEQPIAARFLSWMRQTFQLLDD
jgi:hypothetical protein